MGRSRRSFTKEFKVEAVRLQTEGECSVAQVARDLGIRDTILRRWKQALALYPECAFPGNGQENPEQELRRLRRDNERLRMERDILKNSSHLLEGFPMSDACIRNHREAFPVLHGNIASQCLC